MNDIRFLKGGLDVAIELFAHNQKAYESALQMLEDEHKTAVIHPTGTGNHSSVFSLSMNIRTGRSAGSLQVTIFFRHSWKMSVR